MPLLNYWWLMLAVASFGGGLYTAHKFCDAREAHRLEKELKQAREFEARAAKAEKEKQLIERKYQKAADEIERLRREDADVDGYLSSPIPERLKRLLNASKDRNT